VAEAIRAVVVDHARGLHVRVQDRAADELETALQTGVRAERDARELERAALDADDRDELAAAVTAARRAQGLRRTPPRDILVQRLEGRARERSAAARPALPATATGTKPSASTSSRASTAATSTRSTASCATPATTRRSSRATWRSAPAA
jgi:hypothetical protein